MALSVGAVILAAVGYGSYYVPAKKYEVHDGVVYQWFFCSGIMIGGLVLAFCRNDWWADDMASSAFYVAPEGIISGLAWQFSNLLATQSVRYFGLGNYYLWHELTNLGGTFVIGVMGPSLGIPAKAPRYVDRAALGFVLVFLGMIPVTFMRDEEAQKHEVSADCEECVNGSPCAASARTAAAPTVPAVPSTPSTPSRQAASRGSIAQLHFPDHASAAERVATANGSHIARDDSRGTGAARIAPQAMLAPLRLPGAGPAARAGGAAGSGPCGTLRGGAAIADSFTQRNALTWDGTTQNLTLLRQISQRKSAPAAGPQFGAFGGIAMMSGSDVAEQTDQTDEVVERKPRDWLKGWILALLTGLVLSLMYEPMLLWRHRMNRAGLTVSGVDYVFSTCVGIYFFSTVWLILAGALKRIRGQVMQKSVLRPPLLAGAMWTSACCAQLFAQVVMPYAVAYCLTVGGGLTVSLLWGAFWFGEATSRHNRLCVALTFVGVSAGIVLLGIAA